MVICCELAGMVLLAVATFLADPVAGIAVSGALLLALGWLIDASGAEPRFRRRRKGDG